MKDTARVLGRTFDGIEYRGSSVICMMARRPDWSRSE
jgi:ornithine carbamoyltransferase